MLDLVPELSGAGEVPGAVPARGAPVTGVVLSVVKGVERGDETVLDVYLYPAFTGYSNRVHVGVGHPRIFTTLFFCTFQFIWYLKMELIPSSHVTGIVSVNPYSQVLGPKSFLLIILSLSLRSKHMAVSEWIAS